MTEEDLQQFMNHINTDEMLDVFSQFTENKQISPWKAFLFGLIYAKFGYISQDAFYEYQYVNHKNKRYVRDVNALRDAVNDYLYEPLTNESDFMERASKMQAALEKLNGWYETEGEG